MTEPLPELKDEQIAALRLAIVNALEIGADRGVGLDTLPLNRKTGQAVLVFLSSYEALQVENARLKALSNSDWFDEIAEFLDDYQDAEIIDGTTHPNKAMRLLYQLRETGL